MSELICWKIIEQSGRKEIKLIIYKTKSRSGYWYEYVLQNNTITKYKHHRYNFFDGVESNMLEDVREVDSWELGDPSIPEWLPVPENID